MDVLRGNDSHSNTGPFTEVLDVFLCFLLVPCVWALSRGKTKGSIPLLIPWTQVYSPDAIGAYVRQSASLTRGGVENGDLRNGRSDYLRTLRGGAKSRAIARVSEISLKNYPKRAQIKQEIG